MVWNREHSALLFSILLIISPVIASPRGALLLGNTFSAAFPIVTPAPLRNSTRGGTELRRRQKEDEVGSITCGYYNGDPDRPRSAEPGFDCRIDTERGLWGFCPTSVIVASDCGLAGNCVDRGACSTGCGKTGTKGITTFTCATDQFCSTVILAFDDDAGFSYIACGGKAVRETLFPATTEASKTSSSEPSSTPPFTTSSTPLSTPSPSELPSETQPSPSPSSPAPASDVPVDEKSDSLPNNTGAIIGGVIGGLALVCLSAVATVYILRRNRSQKARVAETVAHGHAADRWIPPTYTEAAPVKPQYVIAELDDGRIARPSELPG